MTVIVNALEVMNGNGTLKVSTEVDEERLHVSLRDITFAHWTVASLLLRMKFHD